MTGGSARSVGTRATRLREQAGAWGELGCGAKQSGVERARSRAGWAVRREG